MRLIGLDVGGTSIKSGLFDENGRAEKLERIPTSRWRGNFLAQLTDYLRSCPPAAAIGIGIPGMLDRQRHLAVMVEVLSELDGTDLHTPLNAAFPIAKVALENDAVCAAIGLQSILPGLGSNYLFVGLGTGVATAAIIDGEPFLGARGNALELGYAPKPGGSHLEANIGVSGLLQAFQTRDVGNLQAADLAAHLASSTPEAMAVLRYIREQLCDVLAQAILTFDLRTVVFGGGNAPSQAEFYTALKRDLQAVLPEYYHDLELLRAPADDYLAARGAAMLALWR